MYNFHSGFYSDVRIEDKFYTQIDYTNKKLTALKVRNNVQAFIRVFDGKLWLYSSLTDTEGIQSELDRMYAQLKPNPEINDNPIVKRFEVNRDKLIKFEDKSVRNIPIDTKMKLLTDLFDLVGSSKYSTFNKLVYGDRNSIFRFWSSKGANITYDNQLIGLRSYEPLIDGDKKGDLFMRASHPFFDDFNNLEELYAEAKKRGEDVMLNAVDCDKGLFPVVLSPMVTGVFAHESFGHKSEADFMIGDETMKKEWAIGSKVGSSTLSIYDGGNELGSGYCPYDDEGTKTKKTYLIKDGILCGRLHNATTASLLDEELTGNARAVSCEFEPIVRMTGTMVGVGDLTFDELIKPIKKGYFIFDYNHGSGMSTFTIAPNTAYEIVDGKLGRPVRISVITGNVFETLGLIEGATSFVKSDDSFFGGCGKNEQFPLPVSMGGPYIRIGKMRVS
ncbi:MAG: TldD/PmbA family protein [Clostridia bacterium]|nr:TldD/PmbA family protein [Clostridia bacterium]